MWLCDYCKGAATGLSCCHCGAPRRQVEDAAAIEVTTAADTGPVYMRGWLTLNEVRERAGLARIGAVEPEVSADRPRG
jgi:hypothetical protein